jgi:hypothetical protein
VIWQVRLIHVPRMIRLHGDDPAEFVEIKVDQGIDPHVTMLRQ